MQERKTHAQHTHTYTHIDVSNPSGISFDLNTSYCVYNVIEKKQQPRGAALGIEVD